MTGAERETLPVLVGQRLYAVEFVLDYVMLKFDNEWGGNFPSLQCFVLPKVVRDREYAASDALWARSLVSLIQCEVVETSEADGSGLSIVLTGGTIVVRPTVAEVIGLEIALFKAGESWMVWNTGEYAFDYLA